ncbi:MarR family transcriptional regulator [Nocardioides zeae]|uniref:MarR family transcriptional regulator n=1 Tax=Nocardioides imazamoxiresistens TaxID=3231893 RepID=A0ABU3PV94_9ACTN|nr:MarR family transcriptional regulator [Nocardioides zeae]MDT9593154.1 MarR family transcriptional regulator [Nocardioides zeae]
MSSPRGWAESSSLVALRRVLARGATVRRVVARRAGLSDHELSALEMLSRDATGPGELAGALDVTRPAATGIVDRLVARGHAERRAHPADRRRTEVVVTDSGRGEARTHLLPMFLALAELDASFDDAEREVVARYLEGVVAALDAVAAEPTDG